MPMGIRIVLMLVGLAFVSANLWRPMFGFEPLTGPFIWGSFVAGVIIFLAIISAGNSPHEPQDPTITKE